MTEMKEFTQEELDFISKLPNSWRDRGLREGREQGMKEGIKTSIINYLELRLDSPATRWKKMVDGVEDLDVLQNLQRDLYRTDSKKVIEDLITEAIGKGK